MVPKRKSVAPVLAARFCGLMLVSTGALYVKEEVRVPSAPFTATATVLDMSDVERGPDRHLTMVLVDQDEVGHIKPATNTVGELELAPKLDPDMVSEVPPVLGAFDVLTAVVTTGASKVTYDKTAPIRAPTLSASVSPRPTSAAGLHANVVEEVHDDVAQELSPSRVEGVRLMMPKLSPWMVTVNPLDAGPLRTAANVILGGSYDNALDIVPTKVARVRVSDTPTPVPKPLVAVKHWTNVPVVHVVVAQLSVPMESVEVASEEPKFNPNKVTDAAELLARFEAGS